MRSVYERFQTARPTPVVIGAGEAGIITNKLERPSADTLKVVAFLDDDPSKQGKRIDGAHHAADQVTRVLKDTGAQRLIVSSSTCRPSAIRSHRCGLGPGPACDGRPTGQRWIRRIGAGQLRDVRIDDLLGRPVIELDASAIAAHSTARGWW